MLIFTLFLTIFLLFTSLDTSGIWNVNMPATKTSTRDTYSALSGSKKIILAKNWSQDPIFVVISFLSILSMFFEFSTGHAFHLFKLIFFVTLLSTILVCHTPGTWNIFDQQREQVLWTIIQHYFLLLTCVPNIHIILCVPSKLHKLFRSV